MNPALFSSRNILIALFLFFLAALIVVVSNTSYSTPDDFSVKEFKIFENQGDLEDLNPSSYREVEQEKLDFGFVSGNVWIGFDIDDYLSNRETVNIEIENPSIREAELYYLADDGTLVPYGHNRNEDFRSIGVVQHPNFIFSVFPYEDPSSEFVLRLNSVERLNFTVTLSSSNGFLKKYVDTLVLVSIYVGIMLALFLYNLALYFFVKDKVYVYYCLYILFIALAQLSLLGYSKYYIFGSTFNLYEISIIGFSAISGVLGVLFAKDFLRTKVFAPKVDKVLTALIVIYSSAFVFRLLSLVSISYFLTDIGGILVPVSFIAAGLISYRAGHKSAGYFLIAWIVFLVGLIVYVFQNYGIIELNTFANLPMLLGSALESVLLSLALANRINILKKENEKEQREKLEVLRENERLIKEQNIYLEKMVQSRTEELEQTLKNLQNTQTQLVNQEKMASLGQLTAGIAHEINNPINFVSSNISPLKRDLQDILEMIALYREKGKEEFSPESKKELENFEEEIELDYLLQEVDQLLQGIDDGARRTVEIVRGLRLFSRVDEQDVKKVDLHDGLDSTLILLNSSMQGRIKVTKAYGDLPMVECLAGKINQVFMNVINNAVHALLDPNHSIENPEIIIRTSHQADEVRIEIEDNGIGMPDHVKEKVFEPFFTTKEVGKGTGLGLSIVYTVIENHKGSLEIYSKLNEGTNFVIKLPVNQKTINNDEG